MEAWTCYILSVYIILYVIKEDHVLMSMHVHVQYIHVHVYMYYTYMVYVSLIVCYLLHIHTQLFIEDPRSSNEITNCRTSSCAF